MDHTRDPCPWVIFNDFGGAFSMGVAGHHYGVQLLETLDNYRKSLSNETSVEAEEMVQHDKVYNQLKNISEQVSNLEGKMDELNENQRKSMDSNKEFMDKADTVLDNAKDLDSTAKVITENGANAENVAELSNKTNKLAESILELKDWFSSSFGNGNNLHIPDYFPLDKFIQFLDSLTLLQESAVVHILSFIVIIFCLFSIIGIFVGNELIKYFDLESKFPSLSTYFKIRAKFQKYFLFWNTFIILFICLVGIGLNILAFMVKG